jgi:hypothetical protein
MPFDQRLDLVPLRGRPPDRCGVGAAVGRAPWWLGDGLGDGQRLVHRGLGTSMRVGALQLWPELFITPRTPPVTAA